MTRREDLPERLLDLAADRALGELTQEEARELDALLAEHSDASLEEFELIAAELALEGLDSPSEYLPEELHRRLITVGASWNLARFPARPAARSGALGWWVAAAAALLAVAGWWPRGESASAQLAALSASPEVLRPVWEPTENAPGASGEVLWSQREQRGFLRIRGLQRNDPTREQYQLWILDSEQLQPIDGGVFDITGDEALIEIDAKLAVASPTAFAVTLEKPGGVVVSDLGRVVLMATL